MYVIHILQVFAFFKFTYPPLCIFTCIHKNMQPILIDYRGSPSWCVISLVKPNCNKHAMCLFNVLVIQ